MKNPFSLESYKTLADDLHILCNNEFCEVYEEVVFGSYKYAKYHYKHGVIAIPRNNYGEGIIKLHDDTYKKDPAHPIWYIFRTASAIWQHTLRNDLFNYTIRELKEIEQYNDGTFDPTDELNKHLTEYRAKNQCIPEIEEIFKQANWIIPYYIYWKKEKKIECYAVVEMGKTEGTAVLIPDDLTMHIYNLTMKHNIKERVIPLQMKKSLVYD